MKGVESIEIEIVRLAHARDLPLPDYATSAAAGADLLAAIAGLFAAPDIAARAAAYQHLFEEAQP